MTTTLPLVESFLQELAAPMRDRSGCEITVESREANGAVEAYFLGTYSLRATYPFSVTKLALEHAYEPKLLLQALAGDKAKPFAEMLRRAADAATLAWKAEIDKGFE